MTQILPGDIVLTRGNSWLAKAIRWGERTSGEDPSVVNHAAIVVEGGDLSSAVIVESDLRVRRVPIGKHHSTDGVYVFRLPELTYDQRAFLVVEAEKLVGKQYGYLQILAQLVDHKLFAGRIIARRLLKKSPLDICSRLVAELFEKLGIVFGTPAFAATPDDLFDWFSRNRKRVELVACQNCGDFTW
jgi:hypothetical protein